MSDTNSTPAEAQGATTNALADPQADENKFLGFAVKDGERIRREDDEPKKQGGEVKAKVSEKDKGTDDSDEPDEDDDNEREDGDEREQQRRKSAQERINKAVARQRAAERERDALRGQVAELSARLAALEGRVSSGSGGAKPKDGPPSPKDYEYGELDAAYIRDLARYEARQELLAAQKSSKQEEERTSQTRAQQELQARLSAFYEKGLDIADDFEEIVSDPTLKISPVLGELALESELGPQIIYAMATDPKEAKRVSAMSPARQAAWFGQKEAELSSESSGAGEPSGRKHLHSDNSPKTTQAPPPPKSKPRGSGSAQKVSPSTEDFAAFEKMVMGS